MARILVIDDAATVRHLMRRVLSDAGHEVVEAQDGEIGLRLFAAQPPALVITDLFMPNCEGIETIQQLRRLSPNAQIIAMSASSTASGKLYLNAARKLGADAILPKPFKPAELLAAVDRALEPLALGEKSAEGAPSSAPTSPSRYAGPSLSAPAGRRGPG